MPKLFLDTETFSEANLKKTGSYRYAEDPTTEILLFPYAIGRKGEPKCWDLTDQIRMPKDLRKALKRVVSGEDKCVAHNGLLFDRLVIREFLNINIPVRQMEDTMIMAMRHALPAGLGTLSEVFNLDAEGVAKDKAGKKHINMFCKPTPKNWKSRRRDRHTNPKEWKGFVKYAKSDISSMRSVYYKMPQWGNLAIENDILELDIEINDRGFFVDVPLANAAIDAVAIERQRLRDECEEEFDVSPTSTAAFLKVLQDIAPAFTIPNCRKATLLDLLTDEDFPDEGRTLIELRLGAASTASTKYLPLLVGSSIHDGRRRGCFQYGGAKRTLRWAGKGFQPQNLARGFYKHNELAEGIACWLTGKTLPEKYDVIKFATSTVRSCIIPEPGYKFVINDYSNVEGRGLAWLAGEDEALKAFEAFDTFVLDKKGQKIPLNKAGEVIASDTDADFDDYERYGPDIYKKTIAGMLGKDITEITPYERQIGKACELGLGFGGGVAAFVQFSKGLGLDLDDLTKQMKGKFPDWAWKASIKSYEWHLKTGRNTHGLDRKVWLTCDSIKRLWRAEHPKTEQFWYDLEAAAKAAIDNAGETFWAGARVRADGKKAISFTRTVNKNGKPGTWLKMELPSGRTLSYPAIGIAMVKEGDDPEEKPRPQIKYKGEAQGSGRWITLRSYGGKLAENATQALCRDILAYALLKVKKAGWCIVMHVHDEIVTEMPDKKKYNQPALNAIMCKSPKWARGTKWARPFPIAGAGEETYRYLK